MEEQVVKIQRSAKLIKGFMVLVIVMQVVQLYQTHVMDFGAIAGALGVLFLLRGLLLSPVLLATPLKLWFQSNFSLSKESYLHFLLAFVLIVVSSF
jgi:hypothetical protein